MKTAYYYACSDYPGMEECPGLFQTETTDELWKVIELHASVAHGENPLSWSAGDREFLKNLIKTR